MTKEYDEYQHYLDDTCPPDDDDDVGYQQYMDYQTYMEYQQCLEEYMNCVNYTRFPNDQNSQ